MSPPAAAPSRIEVALIKVDGAAIDPTYVADLLDVRVYLTLNGVSEATLRLYDADFSKADSSTFDIGSTIEIAFGRLAEAPTTVFKGEIVAVGIEQGPTDLHELVVTCFDKAHRLARSTEAKTYQKVTYRDVINQIAQRHGLTASFDGEFGTTTHPYLLQTSDDAAFVAELTRRSGHQWRVDDSKLEVIDGAAAAPSLSVTWGEDLLRFRARLNGAPALDDVTVRAWDPLTKQVINSRANAPSDDALSSGEAMNHALGKGKGMGSAPKRVSTRQVFTSAEEGTTVATAMRQEIAARMVQAKGEALGMPALLPGAKLTVAGVGSRMQGDYFITSVEHLYRSDNYVTRFTAGPITGSGVSELLNGAGTAPTTHLAPVIGIVTNNKDADGREGVVRVKFPTFGDNIESAWARIVSLGAGATRGLQMMPAVDDEVLVVFEGGDYRRPLVIGGVWNGSDKPKIGAETVTNNGAVVQWAVTTAKGQQLVFDDSQDGQLNVLIATDGGATKLYLGKDKVELFSNQKTIEVKSGQADILLDGQSGDVTIKGTNVKIQATQSVKVTANQNVELAGQAQAKLSAPMVAVQGQAKTDLGGGVTSISGTPVKIN